MNRLKYVLGINIPRRIPSGTAIVTENRTQEICKKHSSEMYLRPLSKTTRLFSSGTRRINDFRSLHCIGPVRTETLYVSQRKPKSDSISLKRTPLEKNYPMESVQRRHNSMYQLRKPSNSKHYFVQINPKMAETLKHGRNSNFHEKYETDSSLEKEPRTYAEMIASYSQTMYTETTSGVLKDGLSTVMINGVHRSPFSTASMASLKWKNKAESVRNGYLRASTRTTLNQEAKFSSDTSTMGYECRNNCEHFIMDNIEENNKLERSSSYATIIERYSNVLDLDGWSINLIPKRNVSMNLNDFSAMLLSSTDGFEEFIPNKNESFALNESSRRAEDKKNRVDWMAKVEDVIKDLKKITAKDKAVDSKPSEKWALQSVNEQAEWLDRVVSAHKKKKSKTSDNYEPKSSTTTSDSMVVASNKNRGPTNNPKPKSIADYIKRGPVGSTTSSQPPKTVATGSAKQPQIELRMTPSQNESVVSINVDELAAKTAGTSAKEQLSVIISSKKNNAKVEANNPNVRSNFDSMQISISENTVPVKQLEFSINGKPVSELKSIVARADKLDVFSSMDKVEIRIPQSENKQTNTMRAGANSSQVLNLQIAAKFNEPRVQQPRDTGVKTSTTVPPSPMSPTSPPVSTPKPTPTQVPPYKPPRMQNLSSDTMKNETVKTTKSADANNVKESEDIAATKKVDDLSLRNEREKVGTLSTMASDDAVLQKSNLNMPSNNSQQPTMNENSIAKISNDDRIPSTVIPWWSSEDSFRKIRKKGNTPKNASAFENNLMKKVEEDTNVQQKFEQTFNPGGEFIDLVNLKKTKAPVKDSTVNKLVIEKHKSLSDAGDFQKTEPPMKDLITKPVAKKNEGSYNSANQNFRVVRLRSPRKSASIKYASKQRSKVKKVRYRVKRPRISVAANKESEKPIVSAVRSPKVVKYVSMNPQRISVNDKSGTKAIAAGVKDKEASEASTKIKKVAEDVSSAEKTNVQHSNTVFKTRKDLEKPANKSADISATSSTAREPEKRDENAKNLPSRREPFEKEPDQRIKQILKSLKPIEKRKDGTLIDYGVVVPSRKPSTKFKQVTGTHGKFDGKEETSRQEKIVEPQKVSSTDKKMLTESKNEPQVNIVGPEKISSVKKPTESENLETKYKKNELSASEGKKENREEKSVIVVKDNLKHVKKNSSSTSFSDKNQLLKVANLKPEGLPSQLFKSLSKINNNTTSSSLKVNLDDKSKNVSPENSYNSSKLTSPESRESKITLEPKNKDTFPIQPFKASVKSNATNFSKLKLIAKPKDIAISKQLREQRNIIYSEKPGFSENETKLERTLPIRPFKFSIKTSDTNIGNSLKPKSLNKPNRQDSKGINITSSDVTNYSKLKPVKEPTSRLQSVEKTGSKSTLKPGVQEKVPLEEIARSSRMPDKKVTRTDSLPLMGTIVSPSLQVPGDKPIKSASKSSGESNVQSGKKVINTKVAPLEGTINYESIKKLDNPTSFNSPRREKKTLSEVIEQRKKDLSIKLNNSKPSSSKGGGSSGSNGPGNNPILPAGLRPSRSITVSQICSKTTFSCMEMKLNGIEGEMKNNGIPSRSNQEHNHEIGLYLNEIERPEKNILYSSWLQRFKNKLNNDKVT